MKIGVVPFIRRGPITDSAWIRAFVKLLERLGIESVWTVEHIAVAEDIRRCDPDIARKREFQSAAKTKPWMEAIKHTIEEAPKSGPVLDAAIIAQYQRMTHYGITGFGTVAAFAKALKLKDDTKKLDAAVKDMHRGDDLMSELAESAVNVEAVDA